MEKNIGPIKTFLIWLISKKIENCQINFWQIFVSRIFIYCLKILKKTDKGNYFGQQSIIN